MSSGFYRVLLAFALAVSAPAFASDRTTALKSVTIATGEYKPFVSEEDENGGLVNHIVALAFQRAGYEASFEYLPWKRALELARRGQFTASSYWYYSKEREKDFIHAGPLFTERLVFFRLSSAEEPDWEKLEDLQGLKIGVVDGYTYTPELWNLAGGEKVAIEIGPSDEANFRKLLAGRLDLFPISEITGRRLLATKFSDEERARLAVVEKPLSTSVGHLLISRAAENAEQIAADFDAALTELSAENGIPNVADALGAE